MKTDRELLVLAAKAAGYVRTDVGFNELAVLDSHGCFREWAPLTDDGDTLRLAVTLKINMYVEEFDGVEYACATPQCTYQGRDEPTGGDPCEAMRRAVVTAAADLGAADHELS